MSRSKADNARFLTNLKRLALISVRKPVGIGLCLALIITAGILSTKAFPSFIKRISGPRANVTRPNVLRATPRRTSKAPVQAAKTGQPWINLSDGSEISSTFTGGSQELLAQADQGRPLAVASADFDGDGIPDLIAGYSGADHNVITLMRGNADAQYPNSPAAQAHKQQNTFSSQPFLGNANVIESPQTPDFLAVGDFNGDGKADVAIASRGTSQLYLLAGDGHGGFDTPAWMDLAGPVTAMAVSDLNRADGQPDIVLGVSAPDGPKLLIFERPDGAFNGQPMAFGLAAPATNLAIGNLDGDSFGDIAVATGSQLMIFHGSDRKLTQNPNNLLVPAPVRMEQRKFPFNINSLAIGNFVNDSRATGAGVSMLGDDGALYTLSPLAAKVGGTVSGLSAWTLKKMAAGPWPLANKVLNARLSSLAVDSMVVSDQLNHQLQVVTDGTRDGKAQPRIPAVVAESLSVAGNVAAVIPLQVNGGALHDLIVMQDENNSPTVVVPNAVMTFTVTNTLDSGPGSLRQAILDANNNVGADTINFSIGSGPQTIAPTTALPAITDAVTIDATSQPGYMGQPIIELNGSGIAPTLAIGLKVSGGNSTVRGMVVNRCAIAGVQFLLVGNDKLENCYLGTNVAGTAALPNGKGVEVFGVSGCTVGGTAAAALNLLSGNLQSGVALTSNTSGGNTVQGNLIGTDVTGAAALGNVNGVEIQSKNNTIGGAKLNVISGNTNDGILLLDNQVVSGNLIQSNIIGMNAALSAPVPNGAAGIQLSDVLNTTIGGTVSGQGNVIYSNIGNGIYVMNGSAGTLMQGNAIGITGFGNGLNGVLIENSPNNTVGGTATGAGNAISSNTRNGVAVTGSASTGNAIRQNDFETNTLLGIDLGNDGVTANDALDADTGPNNLQNYPVLSQAFGSTNGTTVMIPGVLDSKPNTTYTIDFYLSPGCDPSGHGEGELYAGSTTVTTNAAGHATFFPTLTVNNNTNQVVTATATDPNNNTSEFSNCAAICVFTISPTSQNFPDTGGTGTITVTASGNSCTWTAVSNDSFITITSGATGTGSGSVTYTVAQNTAITPRTGTITVANQTFTVTQDGAPCVFSINPMSQSFTAAGGTGSVTVTSQTGCNWTAVSNDTFIHVTSGATGSGTGTVTYSVDAKIDAGSRTGTITIAGQTFTVTQSGVNCTFSISPTSQHFTIAGGTGSVTVTTPGNCPWTAVSNDSFITVTSGATGNGPGTVTYSVAASSDPNDRTGTITIAGQTFTVMQDGTNPCTFSLSSTEQAFNATGGSGSVSVATGANCNWTAVSNAAFITVTNGTNHTGPGSVTYTVANNPGGQRSGTITIAGLTYTVIQAGASTCVSAITPTSASFGPAGGSGMVTVSSPGGNCSFPVTSIDSFITVTSGAVGAGDGFKVKYTVAANAGGARTGFIIIGPFAFTVTQTGSGPACTFSLSPTNQSVAFGGGTGSFTVTTQAGCNWTAVSNAGFITVTGGASGTGSGSVTFSVAANPNSTTRSGTITAGGQTFTVNQDAAPVSCTFSISPTSQMFQSTGGTVNVTVTTQAGCNWTAVSNSPFITVTAGASGTGSGSVSLSIAVNNGAFRTGTVTIAGQTFTVTQNGQSNFCSVTISPSGKTFAAAGGSGTISVTTASDCSWTAVSNSQFVTITSGASHTGNGTVTYTVTSGASRTGTITINNVTFTVKQ